jgi:hypothetical protein
MATYTPISAAPSIQFDSPSTVMTTAISTKRTTAATSIGEKTSVRAAKPNAATALHWR